MGAVTRPDRRPVSAAEIAALTRRLRALIEAGRDVDVEEREAFVADKEALLDRITRQHGENRNEPITAEYNDPADLQDEYPAGDPETVQAEAPASPIGGPWFTVDDEAPGGTRPLTKAELAEITARVQAIHDQTLAPDEEYDAPARYADDTSADEGWSR